MNLKAIPALIVLSLALAGCGNKGSLVQASPPPTESTAADVETAAPAESVPTETPAVETPPAEAEPAEVPPAEALPTEAAPATDVPEPDAQDG